MPSSQPGVTLSYTDIITSCSQKNIQLILRMSIAELSIIFLVCLFVAKPEDIKQILRHVRSWKKASSDLTQQINSYLNQDITEQKDHIWVDNSETINKYLVKIMKLGYEYDGEYDLLQVKSFYHSIKDLPQSKNKK